MRFLWRAPPLQPFCRRLSIAIYVPPAPAQLDRIRRWKLWFLAADWLKQSCFNADDVK